MLKETKVAGLEAQINSFKEQRQGLYRQRAELAVKEMNTYLLMESIRPTQLEVSAEDDGGACSDVADFFKRTRRKMEPKDLIEKVKSGEDGLIVVFKAGVEWKASDSSSSEG